LTLKVIAHLRERAIMGDDRRIPEHVARLLASSIESVERLDILLHLRAARGKTFSARSLSAALRISGLAAEQHLAILCGRGFLTVSIGTDLLYSYQPVSPAIDQVLGEAERLNEIQRADIIRALGDLRERDPVRAFANAFLIRKDEKKKGGGRG
jgi:hypothetical protein